MVSGTELRKRRANVNRGATYVVMDEVPSGYHNRATRRATAHKTHRSKWSRWDARAGKTVQVLPKIYRTQ